MHTLQNTVSVYWQPNSYIFSLSLSISLSYRTMRCMWQKVFRIKLRANAKLSFNVAYVSSMNFTWFTVCRLFQDICFCESLECYVAFHAYLFWFHWNSEPKAVLHTQFNSTFYAIIRIRYTCDSTETMMISANSFNFYKHKHSAINIGHLVFHAALKSKHCSCVLNNIHCHAHAYALLYCVCHCNSHTVIYHSHHQRHQLIASYTALSHSYLKRFPIKNSHCIAFSVGFIWRLYSAHGTFIHKQTNKNEVSLKFATSWFSINNSIHLCQINVDFMEISI